MEVSIRDLKNRLSEYLRLVASGEEVVVTSRGKPVARLLPPRARKRAATPEQEAIAHLRRQSWLRPAQGKRSLPAQTVPWPSDATPLSELVLEDRG
ncbi:MAG: type II toxin-antitoxin system prevent-host-death family antitoxin [Parvularculaceae bacterium]|nr:type II toxin-antitoxin system prevent-host-death family antitoxin [Parvularculaceae bacterium]